MRGAGRGRIGRRVVRSAVAIAVAAAFVAPLGLLLVGSLRPEGLPPPRTIELPPEPTLANYGRLGDLGPFWRSFGTSVWVAAVAVPASILVASWAGFAAARLPRNGALVVVAGAILALSVPATALAVGRAVVYRELGLSGGPWPLLAPSLLGTTPIAVLVFAWRYRTLPPSVYDLARETGLSPVATWWRVVVPLTWSTTAGLAALVFVATWGNVLDPLFFVPDPRWATLPLAVRSLAALPAPSQPVMLAGAVVATVPAIAVVWVLLRRAASGFGRER